VLGEIMDRNNTFITVVGSLLVMVAFHNFQLMPEVLMGLQPVDENSREVHAREVLGSQYRKSEASQKADLGNLHFKLYQEVRAQLAPEHRSKAFRLTQAILRESAKFGFDPVFIAAIIKTESKYNPLIIGGVGEIGLMQVRPETAFWIAKKYKISLNNSNELKDPVKNVAIGVAYLDYVRSNFPSKAYRYIAAYNMGPRNVRKLMALNKKPTEYSAQIYKHYRETYARLTSKLINSEALLSARN
jgi:soluble lytic murein transglycosylase